MRSVQSPCALGVLTGTQLFGPSDWISHAFVGRLCQAVPPIVGAWARSLRPRLGRSPFARGLHAKIREGNSVP